MAFSDSQKQSSRWKRQELRLVQLTYRTITVLFHFLWIHRLKIWKQQVFFGGSTHKSNRFSLWIHTKKVTVFFLSPSSVFWSTDPPKIWKASFFLWIHRFFTTSFFLWIHRFFNALYPFYMYWRILFKLHILIHRCPPIHRSIKTWIAIFSVDLGDWCNHHPFKSPFLLVAKRYFTQGILFIWNQVQLYLPASCYTR